MRRTERALIDEYRQLVKAAVDRLVPSTASIVLEMIQLPDMVRGYEGIKLSERRAHARAGFGVAGRAHRNRVRSRSGGGFDDQSGRRESNPP